MEGAYAKLRTGDGQARSLGCCELVAGEAVNFALRAPGSKCAWLVLWPPAGGEHNGSLKDKVYVQLDQSKNRTGDVWHIEVLPPFSTLGMRYAWLLDPAVRSSNGQLEPDDSKGLKYIIDPCARALDSSHAANWNRRLKEKYSPKAIVPDYRVIHEFDWQGVVSPGYDLRDLIIYEAHVRGFTKNPDSGISSYETHAGTYQGFLEKIPYLVELGINCVELLPIFEFDETACPRKNPLTGEQLCNYWGYSTVNFYVPMQRFNAYDRAGGAIVGFKTLVRELHRVGIEVILDVVFNHTAEGTWDELNWHSLAAIAKSQYYILSKGKHTNYTGCGNTINANDPMCAEWICDCLRYWVSDMHVDGFRFDLASALTRGGNGAVQSEPLLLKKIAQDETLKKTKLIAEPWDCSWPDGYLVGRFPSCGPPRWAEWNGKFRDAARQFMKGDCGTKGEMATRLCGSSDLFKHNGRSPYHSINFITAHDGFTLADLVSYNGKHNACNGENSGDDHNNSWNCGPDSNADGRTGDGGINHLRGKQHRNFLVALLLGVGTPMLTYGDEYGRSQHGCNNGWCQDAISWFSWSDCEKQKDKLLRFCRLLIRLRKQYKHIFCRDRFLGGKDIWWRTDWDDTYNFLSYVLHDNQAEKGYVGFLIAFNAGHEQRDCFLPEGKQWYRVIDTNLTSPKDFCEDETEATKISGRTYGMQPYSCIVLKTFTDSADAVNYGESDSKYSEAQDLEEVALRLKTIANRQMSGELLSANSIEPEQVQAISIMKKRSCMSGCFIEVLGENGEVEYAVERPVDEKEDPTSAVTNGTVGHTAVSVEDRSEVEKSSEAKESTSIFSPTERKPAQEGVSGPGDLKVKFLATVANTQPGDMVYVVGDLPGLGAWVPAQGLLCKTTAETFPVWTSELTVDTAVKQLEFKLVVSGGGRLRWEDFPANRKLELPGGAARNADISVSCHWGKPEVFS
mmetsp:Transcript_13514/g.22267  ORF Transcript_13514/g.22267 Transcript_13514/m.22267 type:complete len:961 (-) Transcript_13514:157-3039(-)